MANTILVKGRGIRKEAISAAVVAPGMLVTTNASGLAIPHGGAGLNAIPAFAVEDELTGSEHTVSYVSGDNVIYEVMPPGAEILAKLAANAADIAYGSYLESSGDGYLRLATTDPATDDTQRAGIVARAIEAVNNSAGPAGTTIIVEIV